MKPIDIGEFRDLALDGTLPQVVIRLAAAEQNLSVSPDRVVVGIVASDSSVDRMGDTINENGWDPASLRRGVPLLFGHDSGSLENIIGDTKNWRVASGKLVCDARFMSGAINPNAEVALQMVKAGFLRTVSVGFRPLEARHSKTRPGGVDFIRQELLELSLVPVPANPNAIIEQVRAAGIRIDRTGLSHVGDAERARRLRAAEAARLIADNYSAEQRAHEAEKLRSIAGTAASDARDGGRERRKREAAAMGAFIDSIHMSNRLGR